MNAGFRLNAWFAVTAALAAVGTSPAPADWARFRGPNGNGILEDKSFDPAVAGRGQKLWTAEAGKGYSALSIAEGRAFTLGNDGGRDSVICYDASSGKELWRHSYAAEPGTYPGPRASPWIDGTRVYTMGYWGHVCCLDAASGKPVWEKDVAKEIGADAGRWGFAGSPLIAGTTLYLNLGKSGCALDKATGKLIWSGKGGTSGYATPVPMPYRGRPHLAVFGAKSLYVVDAANGKIAAEHPWETSYDVNAADPVLVDSKVFISSGYGKGCAMLDISGPRAKEIWRNESIRNHFSSTILLDGHLYACDGNTGRGDLVCLDAASGRETWRQKTGFGSLVVLNRHIVYFNEKGDLIVGKASPAGFEQVARADALVTGGKAWTAPTFSNGRLYLRNDKGSIACIAAGK
jgi:outer membrane protein assembly factor BamB